jgi:hypothetical protein
LKDKCSEEKRREEKRRQEKTREDKRREEKVSMGQQCRSQAGIRKPSKGSLRRRITLDTLGNVFAHIPQHISTCFYLN